MRTVQTQTCKCLYWSQVSLLSTQPPACPVEADIVIVVDASDPTRTHFRLLKDFVVEILKGLPIDSGSVWLVGWLVDMSFCDRNFVCNIYYIQSFCFLLTYQLISYGTYLGTYHFWKYSHFHSPYFILSLHRYCHSFLFLLSLLTVTHLLHPYISSSEFPQPN